MKGFSIIVATDEDRGIGKDNQIPWHIACDMRHFKEITTTSYVPGRINVVIMGRKTWESLPDAFRPLPERINVVLTANVRYELPYGVMRFGSFSEAIDFFCNNQESSFGEVFVIGGAAVYFEAIKHPQCYKIYKTFIQAKFGCDKFFPEIPHYFKEFHRSSGIKDQKLTFFFIEFMSDHIVS